LPASKAKKGAANKKNITAVRAEIFISILLFYPQILYPVSAAFSTGKSRA
jgi:hypothetical protein